VCSFSFNMLEKLVVQRCCCCSLKAGCLTLGIIDLVLDLLSIVINVFTLSTQHLWEEEGLFDYTNVGHEVLIVYIVLTIVLSTISITISTLLIVGICTANYNFIYPTVLWIPASFVINILGFVIFVLLDYAADGDREFDFTIFFEVFVQLCIVSLCWLCVNSYWQQVKTQRGAPQRLEMQISRDA